MADPPSRLRPLGSTETSATAVAFSELDSSPPDPPELADGEVHVWQVDLRATPELTARLGDLLSDEERRRSTRFRFDRHARRFIVCRGALRVLLGRYSGLSPDSLSFEEGVKGKPFLPEVPGLEFNLSRSGERAVVAATRSGPLGVDLERLRSLEEADAMARRFFSRREVETYLSLPTALRQRAFFNCWTRKEAFVKAVGKGLSLRLDSFDVSLRPEEPARLLAVDGDADEAKRWLLTELDLGAAFVGALVTTESPTSIEAWHLPHDLLRAD